MHLILVVLHWMTQLLSRCAQSGRIWSPETIVPMMQDKISQMRSSGLSAILERESGEKLIFFVMFRKSIFHHFSHIRKMLKISKKRTKSFKFVKKCLKKQKKKL